MLDGEQIIVAAHKTTEVIGELTLPYTDPKDINRFASAISNPPGKYTRHPALTLHRYGRGRALYSAGDLEKMAFEKHAKIFAGMIKTFLNKPAFETDAPKAMEIIVFRQAKNKRLIINVLNFQKQIPPVPAHDIRIKINPQGLKPARLIQVPDEKEIAFETSADGGIEFVIDKVEMLAMLILEGR
jgi:hypothetical protein